jgi:transposase-like protein
MKLNDAKNGVPLSGLTANQEKAVRLVFLGKLTEEEIASALGLARTTVQRWKKEPAFRKRLEEQRDELRAEMGHATIADQLERLKRRNSRWNRDTQLIESRVARFTDPALEIDPDCAFELATGMYKKKVRRHYDKEGNLISEEVEAVRDTGLDKALHDNELLTAKELGELVTKNEISGPGGKPIQIQAEVSVIGYGHGGIADALRYWMELYEVERLPTTPDEGLEILKELDARERAARQGKYVPPLSEPFHPELDTLSDRKEG